MFYKSDVIRQKMNEAGQAGRPFLFGVTFEGEEGFFLPHPLMQDEVLIELRRELLASCNLHTVLDCPSGTFQGAGVKTVVLFFDKGAPTRKVWYYQLDPGRSLGKTNPLNDDDLKDFVARQASFEPGFK